MSAISLILMGGLSVGCGVLGLGHGRAWMSMHLGLYASVNGQERISIGTELICLRWPTKNNEKIFGQCGGSIGILSLVGYVFALPADRKSTRLNSSHQKISYAVFC